MSVFVFDANAVVSAALNPTGVPRRALALARARGTLALSPMVYNEVAAVLARPKFARVMTEDRRREALQLLSAAALWVDPRVPVQDCRDAKDNCYLELALAAGAAAIVTGDADLLTLHPWRGIPVLKASDFLDAMSRSVASC